jgi:hypothetical protein
VRNRQNASSPKRKTRAYVPKTVEGFEIGIFKWRRDIWSDGTRAHICDDLPNGCSATILSVDTKGIRGGEYSSFRLEVRSEEGEIVMESGGYSLNLAKRVAELAAYRHNPYAFTMPGSEKEPGRMHATDIPKAEWDDRVLAELRARHEDIIGDIEDEVVLNRYYAFMNNRTQDRTTLRSFLAGEHEPTSPAP